MTGRTNAQKNRMQMDMGMMMVMRMSMVRAAKCAEALPADGFCSRVFR